MKSIIEQLDLHEGFRKFPYKDTEGYLTIGYGWNLDVNGLPEDICEELLRRKVNEIYDELSEYEWFCNLDVIRKKVLLDMGYNLGINGLMSFKNMIQCLKDEEYIAAANAMKNSKWHHQVGTRAERLEEMMKTGEDYD